MTVFEIIWSDPAIRQLKKRDRSVARRIFDRVGELSEHPDRLVQRLVNSPYDRLRVGDYRVILDIQGALLRVLVLKWEDTGSRSTRGDCAAIGPCGSDSIWSTSKTPVIGLGQRYMR